LMISLGLMKAQTRCQTSAGSDMLSQSEGENDKGQEKRRENA